MRAAGYAPHLDYRPPTDDERARLVPLLSESWIDADVERPAQAYALEQLLPKQQADVYNRTRERVDRVRAAVRERLTKEIIFREGRAAQLHADERAGKQIRLNWQREQMGRRTAYPPQPAHARLGQPGALTALPPRLLACACIIPTGFFVDDGQSAGEALERCSTGCCRACRDGSGDAGRIRAGL